MDIFKHYHQLVSDIIIDLSGEIDGNPSLPSTFSFQVERPNDKAHGDLAINAAMVLAKPWKMNPREIAQKLISKICDLEGVQSASIAGPGFINLKLEPEIFHKVIEDFLTNEKIELNGYVHAEKINVEYVSANPTGPLHLGHVRGAVFGDALASLLEKIGHDVTREYYVNDAGNQIDALASSVFLRYREALGEDIGEIPKGMYPGEYLIPVGQNLVENYEDTLLSKDEDERRQILRKISVQAMLELIKDDLNTLNIKHDVFFSEASLASGIPNKIKLMQNELEKQNLIYIGKLEPPKGKMPDDWEDREQLLFKASQFGDDSDRALRKSDGTHTYFAADVAYAYDKYLRGFKQLIFVLGADHTGYIKRLKAVGEAVSNGEAEVDVKICQLVKLMKDGQPFKMSKRAGTMVMMRDIVDEVGSDPIRFMMLYRKNEAPLDFDVAKVIEKNRENPVFYVQYAHARCASVFRNVEKELPKLNINFDTTGSLSLNLLSHELEQNVISHLADYKKMLNTAAAHHEPHRIAFYLYELATQFNSLWSAGKSDPDLRFIQESDIEITRARLAMVKAVKLVLSDGLKILGVSAPLKME